MPDTLGVMGEETGGKTISQKLRGEILLSEFWDIGKEQQTISANGIQSMAKVFTLPPHPTFSQETKSIPKTITGTYR